jgi:hypothetical protein
MHRAVYCDPRHSGTIHASLCHSTDDKIPPFHQRDPSLSWAATKDSLEPILVGKLWVGERFRKTCGNLIVICGHRNGFFESAAKLALGWPSFFPIVLWKRKGKSHGIQA